MDLTFFPNHLSPALVCWCKSLQTFAFGFQTHSFEFRPFPRNTPNTVLISIAFQICRERKKAELSCMICTAGSDRQGFNILLKDTPAKQTPGNTRALSHRSTIVDLPAAIYRGEREDEETMILWLWHIPLVPRVPVLLWLKAVTSFFLPHLFLLHLKSCSFNNRWQPSTLNDHWVWITSNSKLLQNWFANWRGFIQDVHLNYTTFHYNIHYNIAYALWYKAIYHSIEYFLFRFCWKQMCMARRMVTKQKRKKKKKAD